MANFVLDKGYTAEGTTAYAFGEVVKYGVGAQSMVRSTVAADQLNMGICQETCDATKLVAANTGKVVLNVRRIGIAKAIAGGTIAKGDRLTNDTSCRVVKQVTAGGPFFAIAEEATTVVGTLIDVLVGFQATI